MWSTGRNTDEKFGWQLKTGSVHRSQSFGAGDSTPMPPSHRRHRLQFLANRSLFERTAPSEQPPPPALLSGTPLARQGSFKGFADELLSNQEDLYLTGSSLPPLQIVEEPICTREYVHKAKSNVVDNIDSWQPKWLNNNDDDETYGMGKERKANIKRSNSDAVKYSTYKPRDSLQSRMGHQYVAASKHPMGKRVRDLADAYQRATAEKSKPPMLARRSSMSAMPVKVLARRFSIPNE